MGLPVSLRKVAEGQHGLFSRAQSRDHALTAQQLRRSVASGECEAVTSRVVRVVGATPTFRQRTMAAALDAGPGAAVSHAAAACLWRLPGFGQGPIEVSRPRGLTGRTTGLARLHEPRLLNGGHLTTVHGIPVTIRPGPSSIWLAR